MLLSSFQFVTYILKHRLGRVTPETVPDLLTAVLASPRRPFTPSEPPLLRDHWRGRTGLGEEEQVAFFESSR
jgi:hypothetical protein